MKKPKPINQYEIEFDKKINKGSMEKLLTDIAEFEKKYGIRILASTNKPRTSKVSRDMINQITQKPIYTDESCQVLSGGFDQSELKMIFAIAELLTDHSDQNIKSKEYMSGDFDVRPDKKVSTPRDIGLVLNVSDIVEAYKGNSANGGKDYDRVIHILDRIESKRVDMEYNQYFNNNGVKTQRKYACKEPLLKRRTETDYIKTKLKGRWKLHKKTVNIVLNSVWVNNIKNGYLALPTNKAILQITDGGEASQVTYLLFLELSNAYSNNKKRDNQPYEIGETKLFEKIGKKYLDQRKRPILKKYFIQSLDKIKLMGMVINFEERDGINDKVYIFHLSKKGWNDTNEKGE